MNKNKSIYAAFLLGILSLTPCVWAEDFTRATLRQVEDHVMKLPPKDTLVILDVDGTLTNCSDPNGPCINPDVLAPRGNAVNFVKQLSENGYHLVVSSAWNKFSDTLERLKKIGLADTLKIMPEKEDDCSIKSLTAEVKIELLDYCKNGLVASVRDMFNYREKFFRQKALAVYFVHPNLDMNTIKHVVFADDSPGNIKIFKEDIIKYSLFPNAKIDTFSLTSAKGQEGLE